MNVSNRQRRIRVSPRLRLALLGSIAGCLVLACATTPRAPHRELQEIWDEYQMLTPHRSLAVAGNLDQGNWVAGASSGHDTLQEADEAAIAACGERRQRQRMQAPCLVYARGSTIVARY